MRLVRFLAAPAAFATAAMLFTAPASAQATRTWVSGVGDDANPCSRTAPCKTFAGAISKTAASGEIDCLDPGGFGALTITKAMTILCDAVSNGGVLVSGTNGITVAAGAADVIVLSGLDFEGIAPTSGPGLDGIRFNTGAALFVRNCTIRDFSQNGINFAPGGVSSLYVNNVMIHNSGFSGTFAGIQLRPTGTGQASAAINNVQLTSNGIGIMADGTATSGKINGVVRDSVISGSTNNGINVGATTSANDALLLDDVTISGNLINGLSVNGSTAGLLVANSTIYNNGAGINAVNSGQVVSYGNNRLNANNGNDGAFTSTIGLH